MPFVDRSAKLIRSVRKSMSLVSIKIVETPKSEVTKAIITKRFKEIWEDTIEITTRLISEEEGVISEKKKIKIEIRIAFVIVVTRVMRDGSEITRREREGDEASTGDD